MSDDTAPPVLLTYRDSIRNDSPTWLQDGHGERFMYTLGLELDLLLEKLVQAIKMRRPTQCDPSALHFHGLDRLLEQGMGESDDDYRVRLQQRYETLQIEGNAWGVLREVISILRTDFAPAARTVANRYDWSTFPPTVADSKWDEYDADADLSLPPTHTAVASEAWDWDSDNHTHGTFCWSRFWLVLESVAPNDWVHRNGFNWDDPGLVWDEPGNSWEVDVDSNLFQRLWDKILTWKAANAECACLIVSFDADQFDKDEPEGGGINPDGTFGRWHKYDSNGIAVPARVGLNAVYSHRIQEGGHA